MYSKLTSLLLTPIALLVLAGPAPGQAPTTPTLPPVPAGQVPAGQGTAQGSIHGHITDPSGALMPGARVSVNDATGHEVSTATADTGGNYEMHGLAAGSYVVMATTDGFAPFVSPAIPIAAGQSKRVDISMAIQTEQQNVVVTDDAPTVSTEADANANSLVIKGKDLDALSDDPDELSNELSALAGPSAGPNGGQIYIDGFTGGQLPPKSSIREIRVNQNPYSAEYDKLGFGRIEILTKPGTDKLHGQAFIQGNDSAFNTANPFVTNPPPYYSYQYNGSLTGSLSKSASFFISAEHRSINNLNIFDTPCDAAGNCPIAGISGSIANPRSRTNVSPRLDLQIGQKNTLTVRYQFFHDSTQGNLTSTQLPTEATGTGETDNTVQISDTQIINDHIVNETRFEYQRTTENTTPVSSAPTLSIAGTFSTGGANDQFIHDHSDHLELQNITTMSLGRHAVKFGTRLRDNRDAENATSGFNGSFSFDTIAHFQAAIANPSTAAPFQLNYATGQQNAIGNTFDAALFFQDDWKVNPKLTLSGGLRWESQNHLGDHSDWAPRFSMAWAVDGKKGKQAKTVLRAGYGIFYDRLPIADFLQIDRSLVQSEFSINNPSSACFAASQTTFDPSNPACASEGATAATRSTYQVAPAYRSPYTQQFGASIERQITKTQTATLTYLHSQGLHQLVEINDNAPYLADYNPANGHLFQYFPEGIFKQDQLILNSNARISAKLNVFGFYTLSFANTDGAGGTLASNSGNLHQDYGRAGFVSRNSVFLIGNYSAPWGIRFSPFLIAQSGRPFNIVTPTDLNNDTFINDRPGVVDAANCTPDSTQYKQTTYGCLDIDPVAGEKIIANNAGRGPAAVAVNLRISRTFGIGPKLNKTDANGNQGGGPPGGGPGGGGGRGGGGGPGGGGPGGGFGPGGFGGGGGGRGGPGGMFAQQGSGRKYNLNFSVQALNLFNNVDYGTPIGTVVPPGLLDGATDSFGRSKSLAPGIFSQGSAVRRIMLQAVFSF